MPAEVAYPKALFWFRRDLRDEDNAGLYYALKSAEAVYCAFVFDREILDQLHSKEDRRVEFIWESVRELAASLEGRGGGLIVLHAPRHGGNSPAGGRARRERRLRQRRLRACRARAGRRGREGAQGRRASRCTAQRTR